MTNYRSFSSDATKQFGELLAKRITEGAPGVARRTALVLALQGDLGAGKTTFTQGFFKGLGVKRRAVSPTFVIMRRYGIPPGRKAPADRFTDIFHFDAYRLKKAEDMEVLEFGDVISNPHHIVLVEWPERIKGALPKSTIFLQFQYGKKENERKITVR